jgi:hypothetical protein
LEDREAIQVLQVIWNKVYQGDKEIGDKQLVYVVKKGDAVHKTVVTAGPETALVASLVQQVAGGDAPKKEES